MLCTSKLPCGGKITGLHMKIRTPDGVELDGHGYFNMGSPTVGEAPPESNAN